MGFASYADMVAASVRSNNVDAAADDGGQESDGASEVPANGNFEEGSSTVKFPPTGTSELGEFPSTGISSSRTEEDKGTLVEPGKQSEPLEIDGADAPQLALELNGKGTHQGNDRSAASSRSEPQPSRSIATGSVSGTGENGAARPKWRAPAAVSDADVDEAVRLYNETAAQHSFTPSATLPPQRRHRVAQRLQDIGGISAWKLALSAIHLDDFLMGRRPKRRGDRHPFKLDLRYLLRQKDQNGEDNDVLATLIDRAMSRTVSNGDSGRQFEDLSDNLERSRIAIKLLRIDSADDWPDWAPPQGLFHPDAFPPSEKVHDDS